MFFLLLNIIQAASIQLDQYKNFDPVFQNTPILLEGSYVGDFDKIEATIADKTYTISGKNGKFSFIHIFMASHDKVVLNGYKGKRVIAKKTYFFMVEPLPKIALTMPTEFMVDNSTVIKGNTSGQVVYATLFMDDVELKSVDVVNGRFEFNVNFTTEGEFQLKVAVKDAANAIINQQTETVKVVKSIYDKKYFNQYILKAVDYLYNNYRKLGYDINAVLTHDILYHTYGVVPRTRGELTMCVAAQLEVILTAYEIYAKETGDFSIYQYLNISQFTKLGANSLRGHIWVNHSYNSYGTADALINFGMGERVTFDKLTPGSFVNINRTTKTGHAVTFLHYINIRGEKVEKYDNTVVGFKYFSAQGTKTNGGFDYRYAFFSKYGCPKISGLRDCNVIYSSDQRYLNTGMMLMPSYWSATSRNKSLQLTTPKSLTPAFDGKYFNGLTTDDIEE